MELILADTSIWVDHIRLADPALARLIEQQQLLVHPLIVGEIVLGNLPHWERALAWLRSLPVVAPVSDDTLYALIRDRKLQGSGLSVVDAHLLAAVAARADVRLWTRDKRLANAADDLDLLWRAGDA